CRQALEVAGQAELRRATRLVLVGEPVAQARVERGRDDAHLVAVRDRLEQRVPFDRLVGYHQRLAHLGSFRGLAGLFRRRLSPACVGPGWARRLARLCEPSQAFHSRSTGAAATLASPDQKKEREMTTTHQNVVARAAAVVGLASIGLIHLLDIPGKFTDAPYMGWLYVGLIVGSVGVAAVLIERHDRRAWAAAAAVAVAPLVGYVLTRTVGLPQARDDIGNWAEPLGLASLFVEGLVLFVSLGALRPLPARAAARAATAGSPSPARRRRGTSRRPRETPGCRCRA